MQPTTKRIELEARPVSRAAMMKTLKSDYNAQKSQKVFRLSLSNFNFKKPTQADLLLASPPLTNRENKDKQSQFQPQPHQPIQPKTVKIDNLFSPTRTEFRKITSPTSMTNKHSAIRIIKFQPASPNPQQEIKILHTEPENKRFGHKRAITQTFYPRGNARVPSTDLIVTPSSSKNIRQQLYQSAPKQASYEENSEKLSFMNHEGKINPFYVDVPGANLEEDESPQVMTTKSRGFHRKTNSVTDSVGRTAARINYSTSVSSHNTLHDTHSASGHTEDEKKLSNYSQEKLSPQKPQRVSGGDAIKVEVSYNKHFKTIEKIYEAKQKAQQINDQVVRQSQFIQNDDEEEATFQEMYNTLKSHL